MTELENPPENPCFGCGPQHPRGLRLRFEEVRGADGEPEVRTRFTPRSDEIGWPTLFHHGLHFTVLYESSYWAALTLGHRLWVSEGPITYTCERLPRVGVGHTATSRVLRRSSDILYVRAKTETEGGKPCGLLESTWRPAQREVLRRAGVPLPGYLDSELGP